MSSEENFEALKGLVSHYGMKHFLILIDDIVTTIEKGILSVPLDKDPEKAALSLYAERMKLEGAVAMRNAIHLKVKAIKGVQS